MKFARFSACFCAFCAVQALAIERPAIEEELVVTGTHSPAAAEEVTSLVTIIRRDRLLQLSNHNLVDALRQVPGVLVEEQGGPGGVSALSLRGAESNHTLVLLDGVQLNDPTNSRGGAVDVRHIPLRSIQRVEIVRGAQSVIYGSDALAGVIHIVTMAPTTESQQRLQGVTSENGQRELGLAATGIAAGFGYAVRLHQADSGEPLPGSRSETRGLLSKLEWAAEQHRVDLSFRYLEGDSTSFPEQSGGPLYASSTALDHREFSDQSAALQWQWQLHPDWQSAVKGTQYRRDEVFTSPGIAPFQAVPPNGADTDFTRTRLSWINTLGDRQRLWANLGLETQKESGESRGYMDLGFVMPTDFELSRRTDSAFVNVNAYFGELLIQASARRDAPEAVADNTSLSFGARQPVGADVSLFLNWGEGFKLPSFFALGHPLVGNPTLQPEVSRTWETGLEWHRPGGSVRASYFDNAYRDLIDFDSQAFTNVNRKSVDITGAELEANWRTRDGQWQLQAHATYNDIDAQNPLMGRPQAKIGASANYALNARWHCNLQYLWVDQRLATSQHLGYPDRQTLRPYHLIGASISWQPRQNLRLILNADNLADEDYFTDVGFRGRGRSVALSASWEL